VVDLSSLWKRIKKLEKIKVYIEFEFSFCILRLNDCEKYGIPRTFKVSPISWYASIDVYESRSNLGTAQVYHRIWVFKLYTLRLAEKLKLHLAPVTFLL